MIKSDHHTRTTRITAYDLFRCVILTTLTALLCTGANAQNVAITDDDGYAAHPSAMLDIKSTTKGMLVPRLTTAHRTAVSSPERGLLVFDTDEGDFYFYNGSSWINLTSGMASGLWGQSGNRVFLNDTTYHIGIGTKVPTGKMEVKADVAIGTETAIFGVINYNGDTVFAVYPGGVRVLVEDDQTKADGNKAGFAVGGFSLSKSAFTNNYLVVSPDSVRIYIQEEGGAKAGGNKAGFAVGGFSLSKGLTGDYLNVSGKDSADIIDPAESRVLWYPLKEAFLSGKVIIEGIDSVGTNSMATGCRSKAIGDYSQAFGYESRAYGGASTAIGYYANAEGANSYAFGNYAYATDSGSYAIGSGAKALGIRSFALGSTGIDSAGIATNPTIASGDYSYVFGLGSQATNQGAFAFGTQNTASGKYSLAIGYETEATGWYSTAMGKSTTASGNYSTAIGYNTTATGYGSVAMGENTIASEGLCVAMGENTTACGENATAMGRGTTASDYCATAMGRGTIASGDYTTAMGYRTKANSFNSLAIGRFNDTTSISSMVWNPLDPLFIIGNGSSDASRSNAMTVLKNGNVGIGTKDPDCPLAIQGIGANHDLLCFKNTSGTSKWHWNIYNSEGLNLAETFVADGRLFIKYGGNIGIGTTNPGAKLEVYGGGDILLKDDGNDPGDLIFRNSTDSQYGRIWTSFTGSGDLNLSSIDNIPDIVINSNGDVGIG
ncbi:MAG: hypothetical protein KJ607_05435, partial [Bacteroidetes bacterium]|nr:hypothetical protein [Bacteroidota bacterium]